MTTLLVSRYGLFDVDIGRPSKWGNPFATRSSKFPCYAAASVPEAVGCYARWISSPLGDVLRQSLFELKDKRLACWCKLNQLCHGQVLVALVEGQSIDKFLKLVSQQRYEEILAEGQR